MSRSLTSTITGFVTLFAVSFVETAVIKVGVTLASILLVYVASKTQKFPGRKLLLTFLYTIAVVICVSALIQWINNKDNDSANAENRYTADDLLTTLGRKFVTTEQVSSAFKEIAKDILSPHDKEQVYAILNQIPVTMYDLEIAAEYLLQDPKALQEELDSPSFNTYISEHQILPIAETCRIEAGTTETGDVRESVEMYTYPSKRSERCSCFRGYLYYGDALPAIAQNNHNEMNETWWQVEVSLGQYCWVYGHDVRATPQEICARLSSVEVDQ